MMSNLSEALSQYLTNTSARRMRKHAWLLLAGCLVFEFGLCLLAGYFHQLPVEEKNAVMLPGAIGAVMVQMVLFSLEGFAVILFFQSDKVPD